MSFGVALVAAVSLYQPVVLKGTYGWQGHGGDPAHQGVSNVRTMKMTNIDWSVPVDENPRYSGNSLLSHYSTPCISVRNTVVIGVKKNLDDTFVVRGHSGADGSKTWEETTDYIMPPHGWTPMCSPTLLPITRTDAPQKVAYPLAGGRIAIRSNADSASSGVTVITYYGASNYAGNESTYNNAVRICTPLTAGPDGSIYFGVRVLAANPQNLTSGLVRVSPFGVASWVSAGTMSNDAGVANMKMNAAPAVWGGSVFCVASSGGWGRGYLVKLNASNLAVQARARLIDPKSGNDGIVEDSGTASPMVGTDGHVYQGILENPFPSNHDRGWMIHFDNNLAIAGAPNSFGWDDTAALVPAKIVTSYTGPSSYLLLTKYNDYAGVSGTGRNKMALVDPNDTWTDPISGNTTMKAIATLLGPTPDQDFPNHPGAVREWCVNSVAVDTYRKAVILNCEDGVAYRWSMVNFSIEARPLTAGIGEAYTATAIGPDGHIYATSNARLYALGGSKLP